MTCREKFEKDHPNTVMSIKEVVEFHCPREYGYPDEYTRNGTCMGTCMDTCDACWDKEIPWSEKENKPVIYAHINPGQNTGVCSCYDAYNSECRGTKELDPCNCGGDVAKCDFYPEKRKITDGYSPKILDSGNRREFETGAVRDIQEGKGRCDLLPLDVVGKYLDDGILMLISEFQKYGRVDHLYDVLWAFAPHWGNRDKLGEANSTMLLEVAKHYEEGCNKYGARNWEKGIPVRCYIDSGVRHYLKFLRGDKDEPHDRAFVWNMLGAIWTCVHKPELNEYPIKLEDK